MIELIKAATLVSNPELQKQAELAILKLRADQTEKFFIENAQILQTTDIPVPIRQAAGTLLSVSLKQKIDQIFLWDRLTPASKSSLKDMVLGTMIDSEKIIRRAAANIVAAICCIEIPQKKWEGIAEKITSNMSNDNLVVKEVSILTIGFICQQLKDFDFEFDEPLQETILTGILVGVKDSHSEISETAFKALRDGISSVTSIMKNVQYREFLITQIAEAIRSKKFVEYGLQCLIEFIKYNFAYMAPNYVEGFAHLIDPFLTNPKDETSCILAMEFWATFAKQEKNIEENPNQMKFVVGGFADRLVEGLLQNLCEIQEGEEEENGLSDAASSALQAIFEDDSTPFKDKVLAFTSNTIRHDNWKYRQGSIRAFATLLIGLPEEVSQSLVNVSLIQLVALLNDPNPYVQSSAIKSMSLISEQTGQVILSHANFISILQIIVKKAQINQSFMRHVCKIIDNLCSIPDSVRVLGAVAQDLTKVFLDACLQPNRSVSSINNCFCTIFNLITNSESVAIANKYIEYVLVYFGKISSLQREKKEAFYSGFYTLAQVCLLTIRKAGGSITIDQMSKLYELVVGYYKKIDNVDGDGFYVVSALAFFIPNDLRIANDFWKYIEFGLKKWNQNEVFRATISCICDFATTYRSSIANKVDSIFTELLDIFESNKVSRELKLDILMCFGQLFLQCGEVGENQLKRVMDIILLSIQGVFQISDHNYAEVLQESIVETLMCIYHGLNTNQPNKRLTDYIHYIFQFISMTTDKSRRPKLDYVKQSMILLADIASFYPMESRGIIKHEFIADRLAILSKYNNDGHLSNEIKYIRNQFKI